MSTHSNGSGGLVIDTNFKIVGNLHGTHYMQMGGKQENKDENKFKNFCIVNPISKYYQEIIEEIKKEFKGQYINSNFEISLEFQNDDN